MITHPPELVHHAARHELHKHAPGQDERIAALERLVALLLGRLITALQVRSIDRHLEEVGRLIRDRGVCSERPLSIALSEITEITLLFSFSVSISQLNWKLWIVKNECSLPSICTIMSKIHKFGKNELVTSKWDASKG